MNMAYYVHNVPGRMRVKIPSLKKRPNRCLDAQRAFTDVDEIDRVSVNPATGSVVVHYNPNAVKPQHILDILAEKGYIDDKTPGAYNSSPVKASTKTRHAVGKALLGWALGKALEPTGLSFLASFI